MAVTQFKKASSVNSAYKLFLEVEEVETNIANNTSKLKYRGWIEGDNTTSAYYGYSNGLVFTLKVGDSSNATRYGSRSRSTQMDFGYGGVTCKTYYCNPEGTNNTHTVAAMMGSSAWYTTDAIGHDSSGNKTLKLNFKVVSGSSYVGTIEISENFVLSTIPRGSDIASSASSVTVSSAGTTTALTITVTPKANTFYNKLTWSLGGNSGSANLGTSSSSSPTLTRNFSRTDLLNLLTNNYNGTMTITCSTYSDSGYSTFVEAKSVYVDVSITLKSTVSFTSITGTSTISSKVVAGKSSVQVSGLKLTPSAGASSTSGSIEFSFSSPAGTFYSDTVTSNIFSGATVSPSGTIPASESNYTITFKARGKDSRQIYTNYITGTISVNGLKLNLSISGVRVASNSTSAAQDPGGSYVKINYSATSLNSIGTVNISTKTYTIQGGSATNIDANPKVIGADVSKYVTLTITANITKASNDSTVIYPATTVTYVVPAASFPLDLYHDTSSGTMGVGLGALAESGKVKIGSLPLDDTSGRVIIGVSTQSTLPSSSIGVHDVRSVTLTPTHGSKGANFYFFGNADSTNTRPSTSSTWWSLLHVKGWDGSYGAWEIAGNATNNDTAKTTPLYVRGGLNTSWGSWRQIYDSGHKSDLINLIYPVGSIYMSVNSTSPATLFGGTWVQLKDRFLLGAGDTYSNGGTGGEATHTLTVNEMPSHKHNLQHWITRSPTGGLDGFLVYGMNSGTRLENGNFQASAGGSQAHNNMPPYLVVYMWKRTA